MSSTRFSGAERFASEIFRSAIPVLRIHSLGGRPWKRNVRAGDSRKGPWLPARFDILNNEAWSRRSPSLYLVAGSDGVIRYVGISRNRVKDRWRVSPAYDAATMRRLDRDQLFHSQCWKHVEREYAAFPAGNYEVRCITGDQLVSVLTRLGPPISGLTVLAGDGEGIAAAVERWLCNNQSSRLVSWNVAMTA